MVPALLAALMLVLIISVLFENGPTWPAVVFTALMLWAVLSLAAPAAEARVPLTKREARKEALRFTAPFVDLLDVTRTIPTRMVPPRKCRRVSGRTITCRFYGYIGPGHIVRGSVRVHLQDDGLLGFLLNMPTPLPSLKRSLSDY